MNARQPVKGDPLSPPEYEVIRLRAEGLTVSEAAHRLGKAHDTVRNHITSAYLKLGVDNLASAFIELGWLSAPRPAPDPALRVVPVRVGSGADQGVEQYTQEVSR